MAETRREINHKVSLSRHSRWIKRWHGPTHPLTLSLSKGCPSPFPGDEGQGFDKLSLSGFVEQGA
jgi:hypothetical protein